MPGSGARIKGSSASALHAQGIFAVLFERVLLSQAIKVSFGYIHLHCIQLYLLVFLKLPTNFISMGLNSCNTCNVSGSQLMDHCPECGDPFAYPSIGQKLRATIGIVGILAIAAVLVL